MGLRIDTVGRIMREEGLNEVEAAGFFRWYESPRVPDHLRGPLDRRPAHGVDLNERLPAYVRAMFYEPRSELIVWVMRLRGLPVHNADVFSDYVETPDEVLNALSQAARARQMIAIEELVKWNDSRLKGVLPELVADARSPRRDERLGAERIIADWLLEHGVAF
jgi:hypothetical protein